MTSLIETGIIAHSDEEVEAARQSILLNGYDAGDQQIDAEQILDVGAAPLNGGGYTLILVLRQSLIWG